MNKLFCPQCGTENQGDFKFCRNCGYSFATMFGNRPVYQTTHAEINPSELVDVGEEEKEKSTFKFVGVSVGLISLIGFFMPWIDFGIDITPLLSQYGINYSSFSGFYIPKLFAAMELMSDKLKDIDPYYKAGIPTINGKKIVISWNGAFMLYALPVLSIAISLANYLGWKTFKAFAGFFYACILGVFIYVISQFGIPVTSIMGIGLFMVIACAIFFFFDFWITLMT